MRDVSKKTIYIDMDDTLCAFKKAHKEHKEKFPNIEYPQSQFGFFSCLEPIKGAIYSFLELSKYYNVYILTRPSINNLMCYTEKAEWVKRNLGFEHLNKLIISCDKSLVKGDYLIDDHTADGQLEFEGEFIQFGSEKFPNWAVVLNYLKK